jgi:capsid assembly protease
MNQHTQFIAWCLEQPWAMMPERMSAYAQVLMHKIHGDSTPQGARPPTRGSGNPGKNGAIAVIPVYGTIVQRASMLGICEGGTSTQQISNMLADANADDSVSKILLDIDSPGGSVYGVQELASEIAASKKPVTAFANSLAASAAYWIGAAASEFFVTPGGECGSIGVWMAHQDVSKALEKEGVDVTLISAGEYKVEGNPYAPLSGDAKKFMQSRIDDYYGEFTQSVARGRKVSVDRVRSGMGKGRVLGADQALSEKMVDGVMTFPAVISRMHRTQATGNSRASMQRSLMAREIAIAEAGLVTTPPRLARAMRELAIAS